MSDNVFGCSEEVLEKHSSLKEKHLTYDEVIFMG